MKLPLKFRIARCRLPLGETPSAGDAIGRVSTANRQSSICLGGASGAARTAHRQGQRGIALVITLIMLAVTLVMAMAFLAVSKRETGNVDQQRENKTAQLAAESAVAHAQAQIVASMLASLSTNGGILASSNAYNLHLFVSTNYINPLGFVSGVSNPTNVNYNYDNGRFLNPNDLAQNIANLMYLPRAPVFIPTNAASAVLGYDFRYYLDLNGNGKFEPNGMQPVVRNDRSYPYYNTNGGLETVMQPGNVLSNFMVGDPEWVGILSHPDSTHSAVNQFVGRYAFIALPAGNALDVNYIYNQALNPNLGSADGFMRNQGVGSWELNLAAFLADLNTNVWSSASLPNNSYYAYNTPEAEGSFNRYYNYGNSFQDALALLKWRYNAYPLPAEYRWFANPNPLVNNNIDNFSTGPLQTNLAYYRNLITTPGQSVRNVWSGADNTNHYFSLFDWLDRSKTNVVPTLYNTLVNHMLAGGSNTIRASRGGVLSPTYENYTFYRMQDQIASDSSPDDGRLNLYYSNAVVAFSNGFATISVVPGAETNFVRWTPNNFFLAAADQMLRTYSSFWYSENSNAYIGTFSVTNSSFGITNIPVWVSNRFVYTPSVQRLLQLAANIYDASSNYNNNLPHVYRPLFRRVLHGTNNDIYIMGYIAVNSVKGPADNQLALPYDVTQLSSATKVPIVDGYGPVNVYGVPWIIGAKKGLPNFNQLSLLSAAQVTRKLEFTRASLKATSFTTNQAYIIGVSNQLGVTFWNSYSNAYPRNLRVVVADTLSMAMTNRFYHPWLGLATSNYFYDVSINRWPGSNWKTFPNSSPNSSSFWSVSMPFNFLNQYVYNQQSQNFLGGTFQPLTRASGQLYQLGLLVTNYLQAYILDGTPGNYNVIDYVQLRAPITESGLNQALADPNYPTNTSAYMQWSTNAPRGNPYTPYGVLDQIYISGHPPAPYGSTPASQMPVGGQWSVGVTPLGSMSPAGEAAFFNAFFTPGATFRYGGKIYNNTELSVQAPYTPTRTVYSAFLLQANDPLVHYLSSDLNAQAGTLATWANGNYINGVWTHSDDPGAQPLPTAPLSPVAGRYQPWGNNGQMAAMGSLVADGNPYNLSYKDPLVFTGDYWDFPTNQYPTVGWLGRVHRGTPWQTVYLKSTNVLVSAVPKLPFLGVSTWADWTGNIQTNPYYAYFDAINTAPQQDFLLFDLFTTRYNDNSVRGTLPVNVDMGRSDGGLAAWSALFSGMPALSNTVRYPLLGSRPVYVSQIISPVGMAGSESALWKIVNGPNGINVTRANTNLNPHQAFLHAGQILATPALSVASPFLNVTNTTSPGARVGGSTLTAGINDEMYEWLPQQMMGLVRGTEQRYVLYCFGQALRPAPNGSVSGGAWNGLVTNYQVTAQSVVRAVIRVDNANTTQPHAVVESYNVLPPF